MSDSIVIYLNCFHSFRVIPLKINFLKIRNYYFLTSLVYKIGTAYVCTHRALSLLPKWWEVYSRTAAEESIKPDKTILNLLIRNLLFFYLCFNKRILTVVILRTQSLFLLPQHPSETLPIFLVNRYDYMHVVNSKKKKKIYCILFIFYVLPGKILSSRTLVHIVTLQSLVTPNISMYIYVHMYTYMIYICISEQVFTKL